MDISLLRTVVTGTVVSSEDAEWNAARRFHSGVGEPDVIVQARSVGDVQEAVRFAAASLLPITVRSGGHSAWGTVPGGVTIDLARLVEVSVDDTLVHVGGGATWGAIAATLAEHGLGLSSGDTASVGVGGLTLGGGIGWMVRAWGLAADQLVGVELVTASGDVLEVTGDSHPELFWALRGGGGNFGVVTRFDFQAHALPNVVFATMAVSDDARPVLRRLRDVFADAPRELTASYMDVPAMDPSAPAGASITACWAGDDVDAARAVLAPLLALDGVTEIECDARPYPEILMEMPEMDPEQPMPGFIGGNTLARELTDELIDRLARFREANAASIIFLRSLGGAFGDVAQDDSPFPARDATWFVMAGAFDVPGLVDDAARTEILASWDAIAALGSGFYGNFTDSTDASLVGVMFPPAVMTRLAAVKREWDAANQFRRNHNVLPA